MVEITAKMVAALRAATGMGMMECKKALVEADGDAEKAEEILRIKSGNKAIKLAGRTAAEGKVAVYINDKVGALAEINCETDFVAKDVNFLAFSDMVARIVAEQNPVDVTTLASLKADGEQTVEDLRKALIAKLGENISVRRFVRYQTSGKLANYLHGAKIGVIVDFAASDDQLGRDVAMHIAASKPICVSKEQVSTDILEKERHIYTEQAAQSGKPADIVSKIVDGRVAKFLAEVTLLGQTFVKNPDQTVEQLLKEKSATVNGFTLYIVGEGIEKEVVDYAAEVAAAAKI